MKTISLLLRSSLAAAALICLLAAAPAARAQTPFSAGARFVAQRAPELGETLTGYGFVANYSAYLPFISLEGELNIFPTSSTGNLGATQALIGINFGKKIGPWAAYAKFHPGFTHYGGGAIPNRLSEQTHFAMEIGGVLEYQFFPKLALRGEISNISTHYGNSTLSAGPGASIGAPIGTRNELQGDIGLMIHF
jgi:hypothetical protein